MARTVPARRALLMLGALALAGVATGCQPAPALAPPAAAAEAPAALVVPTPHAGRYRLRGDSPYTALFVAAGRAHLVDPAILEAMARVESAFQPRAKSPAGALGLMQLMPATARALGVDPMDPGQAVDGAARLLAGYLAEFGRIDWALAAYNAGGPAVRKHHGVPPFRETRAYVAKIEGLLA